MRTRTILFSDYQIRWTPFLFSTSLASVASGDADHFLFETLAFLTSSTPFSPDFLPTSWPISFQVPLPPLSLLNGEVLRGPILVLHLFLICTLLMTTSPLMALTTTLTPTSQIFSSVLTFLLTPDLYFQWATGLLHQDVTQGTQIQHVQNQTSDSPKKLFLPHSFWFHSYPVSQTRNLGVILHFPLSLRPQTNWSFRPVVSISFIFFSITVSHLVSLSYGITTACYLLSLTSCLELLRSICHAELSKTSLPHLKHFLI